MMFNLAQIVAHFRREFRAYMLLPLLGLLYTNDSGITSVLLYMLGLTSVVVLATHVWRRLLFPYVDMRVLVENAVREKNMPSAIVFSAICLMLVAMMICGVLMVQP